VISHCSTVVSISKSHHSPPWTRSPKKTIRQQQRIFLKITISNVLIHIALLNWSEQASLGMFSFCLIHNSHANSSLVGACPIPLSIIPNPAHSAGAREDTRSRPNTYPYTGYTCRSCHCGPYFCHTHRDPHRYPRYRPCINCSSSVR
jgi:hypothetical protein